MHTWKRLLLSFLLVTAQGPGLEVMSQGPAAGAGAPHFLKDCAKWNDHYSGTLQGLHQRGADSTANLCFSAYYDVKPTYEIIFLYKGGVERRKALGDKAVSDIFFKACKDQYRDFDCFTFVLPLKDPEKMEDMHASNYIFPCKVKVYRRITEDAWQSLGEHSISTYKQYRELQFRTIYGLK
jgi:hypothetical protein